MSKKVKEENVFTYTQMRLREIGADIKKIQEVKNKKFLKKKNII
jgi:hypothetical protein